MIAYLGQTRPRTLIARLAALGLGELVVRGELPARPQPFAFDNGCCRDWRAGVPFNAARWTRDVRWMLYRGIVPGNSLGTVLRQNAEHSSDAATMSGTTTKSAA